jgi:hypothetical protein
VRSGVRLIAASFALALGVLVPATARASLMKKVALPSGVKTATVRWGYMGGHVHHCVWMRDVNLPNGGTKAGDKCGAPRSESAGTPRYMSADGRAVMVHDPSLGHTGGYPSNWYFVPTACMRLPA